MKKTLLLFVVVLALGAWAAAQTQQLQITHGPVIEEVAPTSAVIAWSTNVPSSAILHYGTSADPNSLTQTAEERWGGQQSAGGTTHRVTVKNLQPSSTYYFQVESGQGKGTANVPTKSQVFEIHTGAAGSAPQQYPYGDRPQGMTGASTTGQPSQGALQITHGPVIEQVAPTSAIVSWSTSAPSSAVLHYGTSRDPNQMTQTAQEGWGGQQGAQGTTHRVTINNLQPSTTYYFQVQSGQGQGTGTGQESQIFEIHTPAAGSPPQQYPYGDRPQM